LSESIFATTLAAVTATATLPGELFKTAAAEAAAADGLREASSRSRARPIGRWLAEQSTTYLAVMIRQPASSPSADICPPRTLLLEWRAPWWSVAMSTIDVKSWRKKI